MKDLDPAEAASHDDLIACLEQLYVRADRPSLRELELRTTHLSDRLPGTGLKRVRLGRSAVSEMRRGVKFPRKAFLLTFVEACGVNLETDRRWEQAWDRLAGQYTNQAITEVQAGRSDAEAGQLRQRLTEAEERIRELNEGKAAAKAQALHAEAETEDLRRQLKEAEAQASAANELRKELNKVEMEAAHANAATDELHRKLTKAEMEAAHANAVADELRKKLSFATHEISAAWAARTELVEQVDDEDWWTSE